MAHLDFCHGITRVFKTLQPALQPFPKDSLFNTSYLLLTWTSQLRRNKLIYFLKEEHLVLSQKAVYFIYDTFALSSTWRSFSEQDIICFTSWYDRSFVGCSCAIHLHHGLAWAWEKTNKQTNQPQNKLKQQQQTKNPNNFSCSAFSVQIL